MKKTKERAYTVAEKLMIADGFPPALLLTPEQRAEARKKTAGTVMDWRQIEDRDRAAREAELKKSAAKLAAAAPAEAAPAAKRKEPEKIDTAGKRWDTMKSRWVEDPALMAALKEKKPAKKKAEAKAPAAKVSGDIFAKFGVQEGSNRYKILAALSADTSKPHMLKALSKKVFGAEGREGDIKSAIGVLMKVIRSKELPYGIDGSEAAGYQLFDA